MANLSAKKRRIIKAKIKGVPNKDIAPVEYPDQTPGAAVVSISRIVNQPEVQAVIELGKQQAIKEAGITWDKVISPIKDGLTATKPVAIAGDFFDSRLPDHAIRLKASDMAARLLEKAEDNPAIPNKQLEEALDSGVDEIELSKVVFRKNK